MKIIKLILAVVFIIFAWLQVNDTDPELWVFIYTTVAIICLWSAFSSVSRQFALAVICAGAAFSLMFLPGVIDLFLQGEMQEVTAKMKADKNYIEETREFLGLWIGIATLIYIYKKP